MSSPRGLRCLCMSLVAVVALGTGANVLAGRPQSTRGTILDLEIDSGGETQNVKIALAPNRMRLDMGAEVSMIAVGGDDGKMVMVQHAQRSYIEFTAEMMRGFAGMMGPGAAPEMEPSPAPTFVRTGNTKQVGSWNAYEVRVEHPEQEGEVSVWFSQDVDADFASVLQQMMSSMESFLNNPMLQRMQGGDVGLIASMRAHLESADMPDGFPVQIVSRDGGAESISTLTAIDAAATFDPASWEAPDGYQMMQMPFRR